LLIFLTAFTLSCSSLGSAVENGSNSAADSGAGDAKKSDAGDVPRLVKNAVLDKNIASESSCVLKIRSENDISLGAAKLSKDSLGKEVGNCLDKNPPAEKIVYLEASDTLDYGILVDIMNTARKVQGDRLRFVVSPNDVAENARYILEAKVPADPAHDAAILKPNPIMLVAFLEKDGKIKLNQDGHDSLESLSARLREIFRQRENTGVFKEGTNEVEKTVFVSAPRTMKYGEVIKVIDAVKSGGAEPVGLLLEGLPK